MSYREFSNEHSPVVTRSVEDAPASFRAELVDLLFNYGHSAGMTEQRIYEIIGHVLGVNVPGSPMGSRVTRAAKHLGEAEWTRVFDVILRFSQAFGKAGYLDEYREGLNGILAGNQIAWDLDPTGRLVRVLPPDSAAQIAAAVHELSVPEYPAARALFAQARDAYDDRPRRDRDACSNAFDALESVAKAKYGLPDSTFGKVLTHLRQKGACNPQICGVLESINTLRNKNFGHGMTTPLALTGPEVDFTYLTCAAAILMLVRTP